MERNDHQHLPADLADVAQRMRDERPQASALELDRIKLTALAKRRRAVRRRDVLMRSRLAITSILVVGVLMSGAGAGLAISGSSGSGNASSAQYTTDTTTQEVLPTTETQAPTDDGDGREPAQVTRQVATGGDGDLPFTGFAAIPVLVAGLGLLTVGLVMRRRTDSDES